QRRTSSARLRDAGVRSQPGPARVDRARRRAEHAPAGSAAPTLTVERASLPAIDAERRAKGKSSMETDAMQTRDEVQATMNYVADPEQKPISYMYQPPEGTPQR